MPRYDYRCSSCGREVEVMHGIHESGPQVCDHCGGAMRKALSSPAIHFKGSGWAKKDAAAAGKSSSKTGSAAAGETAAKSTSTGDGDAGSSGGKSAAASDGSTSGGGSGPDTKAD